MDKETIPPKPSRATEKTFDWRGAVYTHVDPGIYTAVVKAVVAPEWVRMYRRWVVKIIFTLLDDESDIPLFLNLGNDEKTPSIARNSDYRKWWAAANGALPTHSEAMLPEVFMEGQIYTVEVADAVLGKASKTSGEIYSKIVGLIDVRRNPPTKASTSKKHEREREPDIEHEHEHED